MPQLVLRPFLGICATALAAISLWGCSERPASPAAGPAAPSATHAEPQTMPLPPEEDLASQDAIKAALPMGNVPATYRAAFEQGQLKRIVEERKPQGAAGLHGTYVFYGARLVEYSGAALQSNATVELRFDLQGAVISSAGSAGQPSEAEISAIRNRAQLLRSHALARKSTREHTG